MKGNKEFDDVSVEKLHECLSNIVESVDCSLMSDDMLAIHRKGMAKIQSLTKKGLAKTGRKEYLIDDSTVSDYIDWVLQRGFELNNTKPSDAIKLADFQKTRKYKRLIKSRVELSNFSEANFKFPALHFQRKSVENSASLHDLRQNIKAIIPLIKLCHSYEALRAENERMMDFSCEWVTVHEHDEVLLELEAERRLSSERKRVIDIVFDGLYLPETKLSGEQLLSAISEFKLKHNCTDAEAVSVFNISRSTLTRLRREYSL